MAELDVQPKRKGSILPWLLLALGIIALIFFLARGCNTGVNDGAATRDSTASSQTEDVATTTPPVNATGDWNDVDFNAPEVTYDEITNKDINVRGNENYGIYGLGENILFDEGKATIRSQAEENLMLITASITKRFSKGDIRIYGHTDATGSAGNNKELAEKRAEAVRNWLITKGAMADTRITVNAVGETAPVASNSTDAGRQQNRRVEIVARGSK